MAHPIPTPANDDDGDALKRVLDGAAAARNLPPDDDGVDIAADDAGGTALAEKLNKVGEGALHPDAGKVAEGVSREDDA